MFSIGETARMLTAIFLIGVLGCAVGRVQIKGISLGTAGIFLVSLLFGHLGLELPDVLQNLGLVLFITAVGFSAGPGFLGRLKKNGLQYVALTLFTASIGCALCFAVVRLGLVDTPLAVGILTGAYTTSPGFAAAKETLTGAAVAQVAAGYGMVYPVGVVCKVLFIQLIPRLLHADMAHERSLIAVPTAQLQEVGLARFRVDKLGIFPFSLAAGIGILLGAVSLPLPSGARFALGTTGGPLVAGLLLGGLRAVGPLDLRVDGALLKSSKDLGLLLFFTGAGAQGGKGVAAILAEYGLLPMVYGAVFVTIPLTLGFLLSRRILGLPLLNGLGAMTASMTCTPSLAILTQAAGTDDVAAAYATVYPIALITMVTVVQFLVRL